MTKAFKQTFFDYDHVDYEVRTNMPYPRVTSAIYLFLFISSLFNINKNNDKITCQNNLGI